MLTSKFSKIGIQIFHMRLKIRYHPSIFETYRILNMFKCFKQNGKVSGAKYFLKIKGHTHNIFSLRIGQDKTGKSILTSPQHQYRYLRGNHCL